MIAYTSVDFARRRAGILAAIAAALALLLVGLPQMRSSFEASLRYGPPQDPIWSGIPFWLESAKCARKTGVLLVICEQGRLVPISDRSTADDPGHALVLDILSRFADRDADLVDIARLNLCINAAGLLLLATMMLGLRLYFTGLVLLTLGPHSFLLHFGLTPHWSFIGLTAMQLVLPLALIAFDRGWMSRRLCGVFVCAGIFALVFAALVREPVAAMAVLASLAVLIWLAVVRWRRGASLVLPVLVAVLVIGIFQAPSLVYAARDATATVEPAQYGGRHGMAHNLYIGLGSVPNKFGIIYSDQFGYDTAREIAPGVVDQSAEYLRVMRNLYLKRLMEDPLEVVRIYFEKTKMVMGYMFLDDPHWPLWACLLLIGAAFLAGNGGRLSCGRQACDVRLGIGLIAVAFGGLTGLQSVVAMPTQYYAMPIGPLLLLLFGVSIESLAGGARRLIQRRFLPAA